MRAFLRMPSKKTYEYDSFEDDDEDDLIDFNKLKVKDDQGYKTYKIGDETQSLFKPPQRLYTYDYITGPWMRQIAFAGIGDRRTKAFLTEEALVNGSIYGEVATRWSQGQEFWEGIIQATGTRQLFFSADSIDELCNMLAEQVTQVPKANTKPNKDMSFSAKQILEPGSLKPFRPVDVEDLRTNLHSMKSNLFSLILTQSRKAYSELYTRGGAILTLKTQRYELDTQIVTEIGWSYTCPAGGHTTDSGEEDVVKHRVIHENRMYRNGTKIPDQQDFFGFPDPVTKEGSKLLHEDGIKDEIGSTVNRLASSGPVLLVFHGSDFEMSYLREHLSPEIEKWKTEVPGNLYSKDKDGQFPIVVQDTQRLYAAYRQEPEYASTILHTACAFEKIPCHKILNAGNASYYLLHLYHHIMTSPTSYQL